MLELLNPVKKNCKLGFQEPFSTLHRAAINTMFRQNLLTDLYEFNSPRAKCLFLITCNILILLRLFEMYLPVQITGNVLLLDVRMAASVRNWLTITSAAVATEQRDATANEVRTYLLTNLCLSTASRTCSFNRSDWSFFGSNVVPKRKQTNSVQRRLLTTYGTACPLFICDWVKTIW